MYIINYINTNEMPNHFALTFFFAAKGTMYHVTIATVIFSHVKITSGVISTCEDIMFLRESSPGISLVFI